MNRSHLWALGVAALALLGALLLSLFYVPHSVTKSSFHHLCWFLSSCTEEQRLLSSHLLFHIRLPRTLLALLSGASLAAAGVLSQGIFRNALASPSLVGSQSGGVLFAVMAFAWAPGPYSFTLIPLSAVLGCLLAHGVVSFIMAVKGWYSQDLVLLGLGVHILLGGVSAWILSSTFYQGERSLMIIRWLFGSYAFASWWDVALIITTFVLAALLCFRVLRSLDVYVLGEDVARSLSVSTSLLRHLSLGAVSLWVGGSVASSGAVPFVGLMAPHMARFFVGPRHGKLLSLSLIIGASLSLYGDVLARWLRYPEEIEVGILLTLLGGGFFLLMLFSREKQAPL